MKVPKGQGMREVATRNIQDLSTLAKNNEFKTEVLTCETSADYASLLRLLSAMVRPFAIAIVSPRG
jgi:hypothetical protein